MTRQSAIEKPGRIDLGAVVSRYLAETQNRLDRLFDEAEKAGGVIAFDEADALFGKRRILRDKGRMRCFGVVAAVVAVTALAFLVIRLRRVPEKTTTPLERTRTR